MLTMQLQQFIVAVIERLIHQLKVFSGLSFAILDHWNWSIMSVAWAIHFMRLVNKKEINEINVSSGLKFQSDQDSKECPQRAHPATHWTPPSRTSDV